MHGLLADVHADAHLAALTEVCRRPDWLDFWKHLQVRTCTFHEFSLNYNIDDASLWRFCQSSDLLLVTANRNNDGPDSLEATIRAETTIHSLPVLTISDGRELLNNRAYAERGGIRMMEILSEIDTYRGCGRLFLP